ncbi:MAG: shikimate dehydrogenase [Deltaproteobacteria bacterium]|nr:shikimate dehydrogenase [Deltaproteobacteria bacterium]MBW2620124.1 shikimate dehydrogenase [Deltaproteobacteria bacterium]
MLNSDTVIFAVLGDPVSHSLSPVMHNTALSEVGYNGVYHAFKVKDIGGAVSGIKALGIRGASITIPHKVSVIEFLDELDDTAGKIGAVNTVINRHGILTGYNSDCLGAIKAILEKTTIKDKNVVIIGAGGAARAIGFGIMSQGGMVTILNRTGAKGERLARHLGAEFHPISNLKNTGCQILINTTPVGMIPDTNMMPVQREDLDKTMVVMDVVYNPLKTRLLREAENIGCRTVDGVSMFVYQGAFQFELWTGKRAPVEVMKKAVLKALGKGDEGINNNG